MPGGYVSVLLRERCLASPDPEAHHRITWANADVARSRNHVRTPCLEPIDIRVREGRTKSALVVGHGLRLFGGLTEVTCDALLRSALLAALRRAHQKRTI